MSLANFWEMSTRRPSTLQKYKTVLLLKYGKNLDNNVVWKPNNI